MQVWETCGIPGDHKPYGLTQRHIIDNIRKRLHRTFYIEKERNSVEAAKANRHKEAKHSVACNTPCSTYDRRITVRTLLLMVCGVLEEVDYRAVGIPPEV